MDEQMGTFLQHKCSKVHNRISVAYCWYLLILEDRTVASTKLSRDCSPKVVRKGAGERPVSPPRDKAAASISERQQHSQVQ